MSLRVADFGLSKVIQESDYYNKPDLNTDETVAEQNTLPVRWCAPEVLEMLKWSRASDVWSFGVFMWEVYSDGKKPYPELDSNAMVRKAVLDGHRLKRPARCPPDIWKAMRRCWHANKSKRPTFAELCGLLGGGSKDSTMLDKLAEVSARTLGEDGMLDKVVGMGGTLTSLSTDE